MHLLLKSALVACIASAMTVFAHGSRDTVAEIHAPCGLQVPIGVLASAAGGAILEAVKAANLATAQARAMTLWGHEKVRLVFANGGWVEFAPDRTAIAEDTFPTITAIQFDRSGSAPATCRG